ncbi:tryptophan synthase beta subunit-like PLP-dependent enzyme [Armillaria gallica]|uniref:Tryptophan synthase beta subunit-like PLP-dependent enzyme n=1 Tax=Armillaria gallica TaxID=47427 RepID=A0A2H3D1I5_ARMGA|nr:tryptophan synthase beta subunit-like PLP-dependent enzyme [Armillaria gallica]
MALTLPSLFNELPRESLLFGPLPIHTLNRMTKNLSSIVKIWAKHNDCNSGLAFSRNKTRKLEYLLAEALAKGADTLVTVVTVKYELKVDWEDVVYDKVGNLQLSQLMGAEPRLDPSTFGIKHKPTAASLTAEVESKGRKPYYIPTGTSDHPLGGLGFA